MNFNFNNITPRRGTGCAKWDEAANDDVLPLWVADMDFPAAPCILQALQERLNHGIFGYTHVTEDYYQAVIRWFEQRHGWTIQRDSILYTIGVVPAISCILKALTMPGERVLLTTPVYNCFFSSIRNNGCEPSESPLLINEQGRYAINWDDFERRCADPKTHVFILSNPHNPGGRVWTKDELTRISEICARHDVWVVSDEIHNELVMPGHHYTPFATVATSHCRHLTCTSASKSFNIAGLQMANIVCDDPEARRRIDRAININEVCDVNPFGPVATIAAYSDEGAQWLHQLNAYIYDNYKYLTDELRNIPPEIIGRGVEGKADGVMPLEGTYLAWVCVEPLCRRLGISSEQLAQRLIDEAHVFFNAGTIYGTGGENHLRINLACPRPILAEALHRFTTFCNTAR